MNTYKNLLVVAATSFTLLAANSLFASESIELSHTVSSQSYADPFNEITLSIHIKNNGNNDLSHVRLVPSGKEFCVDETIKPLHVGYLPAQSENIIQWTAKTPLAIEYFNSGMPVFFHLKTSKYSGENIEIPLISLGGK